jgi:hypothetical protein
MLPHDLDDRAARGQRLAHHHRDDREHRRVIQRHQPQEDHRQAAHAIARAAHAGLIGIEREQGQNPAPRGTEIGLAPAHREALRGGIVARCLLLDVDAPERDPATAWATIRRRASPP